MQSSIVVMIAATYVIAQPRTLPERSSSSRSSSAGRGATCEYEGGRRTKLHSWALGAASDENTDESRASNAKYVCSICSNRLDDLKFGAKCCVRDLVAAPRGSRCGGRRTRALFRRGGIQSWRRRALIQRTEEKNGIQMWGENEGNRGNVQFEKGKGGGRGYSVVAKNGLHCSGINHLPKGRALATSRGRRRVASEGSG